jgi:hypothetical protein
VAKTEMNRESFDFSATIKKAGLNPYVDVPEHVSVFLGKRLNYLKKPESLKRNIDKALKTLAEHKNSSKKE